MKQSHFSDFRKTVLFRSIRASAGRALQLPSIAHGKSWLEAAVFKTGILENSKTLTGSYRQDILRALVRRCLPSHEAGICCQRSEREEKEVPSLHL